MGVMGDTTTAIRDPVFFRWHKFIDDTFVLHKETLAPYEEDDLRFDSVNLGIVFVRQVGKLASFFNCLNPYHVLLKYANLQNFIAKQVYLISKISGHITIFPSR